MMMCLLSVTIIATDEVDIEDEVMQETIAAGRGERDEIGVRDQWSSDEHLRETSKFNARKPISPKVRRLLRDYRLKCDGCDNDEAVARINAFVLDTKRQTTVEYYQTWLVRVVALLAVAIAVFLFVKNSKEFTGSGGPRGIVDEHKRSEIEEQRREAALKAESAHAKRGGTPTWRDNEETEVWTPKQERQFEKALVSFGGIPAKERYRLIAAKVDDKTRQECLMHHKLLQLIAKEQ